MSDLVCESARVMCGEREKERERERREREEGGSEGEREKREREKREGDQTFTREGFGKLTHRQHRVQILSPPQSLNHWAVIGVSCSEHTFRLPARLIDIRQDTELLLYF